jgi:peptidoglycan hydrolase-like protein with peptidoglycan-binding domain
MFVRTKLSLMLNRDFENLFNKAFPRFENFKKIEIMKDLNKKLILNLMLLIIGFFYTLSASARIIITDPASTPNQPPNAISVSDSPDPIYALYVGSVVTFTGNWLEPDFGDKVKMYICKDSSCTNCNNTTQTNCWCYSSAWNTKPDTSDVCTYTTQRENIGNNSYWLGVCDDQSSCDSTPLSGGTFTILAPPGGTSTLPPVSTIGLGNISESLGGQVSQTFESGKIAKVVFPAKRIKGTVVAKIKPKDKTKIIKTNPLPKNTQIVGDLVADFKAFSGGKKLEKFEGVIPITFTYRDEQVKEAGVDEKTLKIYWWDKETKTWKSLKSKVNTLTNTITAYTIHFALFAVMGEIKVPVEEVSALIYEGIPAGFTFEKILKYGDKNNDVKYLQIILKIEVPETYPADVPATGWFGPITKASVIAFQEKYFEEILAPWDLTTGTGLVGSTTRAKLNSLLAVVQEKKKK